MREYRSNFPVGSPRWATRRTQWKALGLTDEQISGPKIAVVNSSSKLAPCFSHLDEIATATCERLAELGAVGFEIRTVAPTDFIMAAGAGGGYVLSSRDLVTADIEAAVEGGQLDAMICLASCDKTAPGQLMAAARLDVPTVIVPCGYQSCGRMADGSPVDIEEVFLKAGHVASGRISVEDLCSMTDRAITGPGVCTGMGTANTMHVVAEALGMTVPGAAPVAANSPRMWQTVRESASAVLDALEADRTPRRIMTEGAVRNAVAAVLAVSGSINAVKHLQAVVAELGLGLDVGTMFEEAGETVRPLSAVRPNGPDSIEAFEAAGGAWGVLHQLGAAVDRTVTTVTGESVGSIVDRLEHLDDAVIRPLSDPRGPQATIRILRGSLAPDGAIVKLSVTDPRGDRAEGPAVVHDDPIAAIAAINAGEVPAGSMLVVRGVGPVGTPGMGMASNVVFALDGAGLTGKVAVITDGQLSGLVNAGIVVGEVKPEAAEGGPLAQVRNGDTITVDLVSNRVDVDLQDDTATGGPIGRAAATPWLGAYAATVSSLSHGAVLGRSDSTTDERKSSHATRTQ
ncbi:dihydroxy-acid dehydratase domain-containing protein [Aeromicrobium sp. CF3.5]|uniref:dihydroxy-acid dehydratase domain-containing protein n=1 Tax=Aeromicrobium sp. CF3.5 TaxID=3373078 RepID=UPI003EE58666